ncbi:ATP12 family protein [Thioclava sp. GXIMD4216]|uniref:ATP12 family chaperone protein n=1 Tax=Thioclava sp. GXIMD4216 TaxID=3131929 RepID=UPI0030CF7A6C
MSTWTAKRFWKETTVTAHDDGFGVALDGRAVKTPAKAPFAVPSRALAQAIAAEWEAQEGEIRPETMPLTRAANAAIDKVASQHAEVAAYIAEYGGTDLLCYRATTPAVLAERQAQGWDPLLAWAKDRFGVVLNVTQGLLPVAQPEADLQVLRAHVAALTPFQLSALHDLVGITGSLILGLAVIEGHLQAESAFTLSRIDESFQAEEWGQDEEAHLADMVKKQALLDAERFWLLLHGK